MPNDETDLTQILRAGRDGKREALDQLLPYVYDELKAIARNYLRRERVDHTLQSTALVNEAYLRLVDQERADWKDRSHFFAIASMTMRRLLVNHARDRKALKRGGDRARVPLDSRIRGTDDDLQTDFIALDDALNDLAKQDQRLSRVTEMRFFAGMSMDEIGEVLGVDARTVRRYWKAARILLLDKLGNATGAS